MKLKPFSNQELDRHLAERISQEREILSEILHLILEVDRRKLFLEMAYPSLFEYLVKHHGYSNGSAHRRIEAARLMKDVPELSEKLESGALNLSQIGLMQKTIRQNQIQISQEQKKELVQNLQHKTFFESQVLIANTFDLELKETTQIQHQKNESVRVELTFSKEQWSKIKHMQELLSHSLPNGSDLVETLEYLCDRVIKQKTAITGRALKKTVEIRNHTQASQQQSDTLRSSQKIQSPRPSIPNSVRKAVLQRDQCCQFKDLKSQRTCGAKVFLQVDHLRPKWAGGDHSPENLQALCATHNRYKYRRQAGILLR